MRTLKPGGPAWIGEYLYDLLLVVGDLGDFPFFSDSIEREGGGAFHVLEEVAVVAEVFSGEERADLHWVGYT